MLPDGFAHQTNAEIPPCRRPDLLLRLELFGHQVNFYASLGPSTGDSVQVSVRLLKILVVEDHADSRIIIGKLLTWLGHHCDLAPDANSALSKAAGGTFDALLTDIGLPDRDGWELLRELGVQGHLPPLVISMSAFDGYTHSAWSKEAGCHGHLVKPFGVDQLKAALAQTQAQAA